MSRKTNRDALLLLLLLWAMSQQRAPAPARPRPPVLPNPLPPGPPAPFPPPGTVPVEPATPDPSLLEQFRRAIEETFQGTPIDREWWLRKLDEWSAQQSTNPWS